MFDLKKRNSLTLNGGRDAEEFRRVAVRRRVRGAEADCDSEAVSSGVNGTYSSSHPSDEVCGSERKCEEVASTSPAQRSPFKPQVPPKPAHLQSPARPGHGPARSPRHVNEDPSPKRSCLSVSCVGAAQNCLSPPSSIRGGGSSVYIRPAQGIQSLPSSPVLGSPSPGKRTMQDCSLLWEGGHSPAKLSPRSHSPLSGKLRTPSPILGRIRSYSPSRNSKSWLGLHKIPSSKMEGQGKKNRKSLSVPDLIVYLDESRQDLISGEKGERSPLKLLHSPNSNGPVVTIRTPANHILSHATNEGRLSNSGKEHFHRRVNGVVQCKEWPLVNGKRVIDKVEKDSVPIEYGSKYTCQWNEAAAQDKKIHKDPLGETNEEDKRKDGREVEPQDEENTGDRLYNVAKELLHTERAYVARLHLLDQVFCCRLMEEAGRGSFPPEVIKNIFSNIPSIYSFHSQFLLPDLESCLRHWYERPGLGHVLLQHAPFLRMYADYVRDFDQALELVRTWTERSSAFRNIIQDIQSQEACGSLTLQHHMLEPVQRIPRYEMLLRDYLKKLPEDNPDYELAHKSLETISLAATHSNSAIHKAESRKRLLEIYEMVGDEEVVNPTNELLREGRLLKLAARNTSAMERHLFLFNNFLLCCNPRFSLVGQRFTVRCRIGVDGMQVQQTNNEDHPFTFQVSGKEKTLELQASSGQDRDEWIKVIQEAIDLFQKKNDTFKLASKELSVDDPAMELGRRAPRWIRDNEVTSCMECEEPFNALTRRRHHCRACGNVVCGKCSDNKMALEYDGNKLNKVCRACYDLLTGQKGEKAEGRIQEPEGRPECGDILLSGFLQYGDDPKTWQRVWSVLTNAEPPVLLLYAAPQDVKHLFSIALTGCSVEDPCRELHDPPCFRLSQSEATHTFCCDSLELKRQWLAGLKAAVTGGTPANSLTDDITDLAVSSGDEFISNDDEENHSRSCGKRLNTFADF